MTIGKWHLGVLTLLVALIGSDGGRPGLHTAVSLAAEAEVSSDVDRYISGLQALRPDPKRWAVIIGIEKYQRTVGALFARRDAQSVKEYAQKLLDVPQENIFLLLDEQATKTTLQVLLEERLPRRLKPGDQVFVYYAGHGLADPRTGQPYLLPSDADPQSIQLSGYSAEAFYGALGRLKEQRVIVFLDACFSGIVGRQEQVQPLLLAARPLVLTVDDPALKHNNVTVLAAAQHDQLSNADPENGHGLFTYHLLRGLVGEADSNGDGRVRLAELASYVKEAVDRKSRQLYGQTRDQTPVLIPAKLTIRQDIELTARSGKLPPIEAAPVAKKPVSPPDITIIGLYEVLYRTSVYSEAREDSRKLAEINAGTRVTVVNIQGDWLEVRSRSGNPPGFIKRDSAVPSRPRAEEPPVIARPRAPEPSTTLALGRVKYQEFPKFRVEVEGLQVGPRGVTVFLSYANKTQDELRLMLVGAVFDRTFLIDDAGNRYKYELSSGVSGDFHEGYVKGAPMILAPGFRATASFTFATPREMEKKGSRFSFTSEQALIKPTVSQMMGYEMLRTASLFNITIRNIEPE